jgi:hypothetical protein
MTQHPIAPPPELVQAWSDEALTASGMFEVKIKFATCAAQWGADQELEACLGKVSFFNGQALADRIRAVRRPKPPSLKEQALKSLGHINRGIDRPEDTDIIRRALEQLDD